MVAGGAAFFETGTTDKVWQYINLGNIWMGWFSLMWFHEFLMGGRLEEDSLYTNWNQFTWLSWIVQIGTVGYGTYRSYTEAGTDYPFAVTVNAITLILGIAYSTHVDTWEERQDDIDAYFDEYHPDLDVKN